jgi:hypothetical protein
MGDEVIPAGEVEGSPVRLGETGANTVDNNDLTHKIL